MIQPERICPLNNKPARDRDYVLYWMQAAQRPDWNHALEYAMEQANQRNKPLLAVFGLTDDYPEANLRQYLFMLRGLKETQAELKKRKIQLVVQMGSPDQVIVKFSSKADLVIVDEGYLRIQRQWRYRVAEQIGCPLMEVTTNLIVPVEAASEKENYSARTLRPRINSQLPKFMIPLRHQTVKNSSLSMMVPSLNISSPETVAGNLNIDQSVKPARDFMGGAQEALSRLKKFILYKLDRYDLRKDPHEDVQSDLSPYLHFGQISPLQIALAVQNSNSLCKEDFLEELIVRRELSHNFVYYNPNYDQYEALPPWALRTLNFHAKDKREHLYSLDEFEKSQTYDPAWNAAQTEMVITGKMHGYMRMYWGKKILEWTKHPQEALQIALYLNNKYELDGRDPNGYAGVAWCLGKHDQGFMERKVFGKIRYMNAAGLKRKFDIQAYIQKIEALKSE